MKEIAISLAKAQGQIGNAIKNSENHFFKKEGKVTEYANLSAYVDVSKAALADNGLSVIHSVEGELFCTRLLHSSGEVLEINLPLLVNKQDMQALKSAITYARRISLGMLCNIADTDDDGNEAVQHPVVAQKTPPPKVPPPPPPQKIPTPEEVSTEPPQKDESLINYKQQARMFDLAKTKGIMADQMRPILQQRYGVDLSSKLKVWQFDELMEELAR